MHCNVEPPALPHAGSEILDEFTYVQLHSRARAALRTDSSDHGFDPADLIHESFLRIERSGLLKVVKDPGHLVALMTLTMRRVLIDYARAPRSLSRRDRVPLDFDIGRTADPVDVHLIRGALDRLANHNPRLHQIVVMRYWCGLACEEVAAALSISSRTVKRQWCVARKWLQCELS
jgi:RNA polymerase sigma-70 factor, ECF subfamily